MQAVSVVVFKPSLLARPPGTACVFIYLADGIFSMMKTSQLLPLVTTVSVHCFPSLLFFSFLNVAPTFFTVVIFRVKPERSTRFVEI